MIGVHQQGSAGWFYRFFPYGRDMDHILQMSAAAGMDIKATSEAGLLSPGDKSQSFDHGECLLRSNI